MRTAPVSRGFLGFLTVLCFGLATSGSAYAVPPPPPFPSFTIRNATPFKMIVQLAFYPTKPMDHGTFDDPENMVVLNVPVGPHTATSFSLASQHLAPPPLAMADYPPGIYGVSSIYANAYFRSEDIRFFLGTPPQITAVAGNYNVTMPPPVPPPPPNGYPGYFPILVNDQQTPSLVFGIDGQGTYAELTARSKWDDQHVTPNPDVNRAYFTGPDMCPSPHN